jgi:hypothetical protein
MNVFLYEQNQLEEWDDFVIGSRNGTIFHTQKFISYHPTDRFEDSSLMFRKKTKLVSVFPAAIQIRQDEKVLRSHPGTSYGGAVFAPESGLRAVVDVMEEIVAFAEENQFNSIEMRLSPRVFHTVTSEDLEYVLWYLGFKAISCELSSAVPLYMGDDSVSNLFRNDTLRSVAKAKKEGVVVRESDHWSDYWKILSDNLVKHRAAPTHSLNEILKLKEMFPEAIKLFGSYYNDRLIGGTVVFYCNSVAAHTFYIAQDYDFQKLRPLNILFDFIVRDTLKKGYRYLNFGISTESGGATINHGLFRFKEGFGGRGVIRKYYRLELYNEVTS